MLNAPERIGVGNDADAPNRSEASDSQGESGMQAEEFQAALERCIRQVNELPESQRGRLMELASETKDRQQIVDDTLRQALDAIDDWRLQQKYMIFDMEARQRELAEQAQNDADNDFSDDVDWI